MDIIIAIIILVFISIIDIIGEVIIGIKYDNSRKKTSKKLENSSNIYTGLSN